MVFCIFKKSCLWILVFLMLLSCTGCWNRRELSEIGIVGAVAVDVQGNQVRLTYELVTPKRMDMGGDKAATSYFQSEGDSIFEANRNATQKYDKKLFWPHANVFFFSEEAANQGLLKYLDYFNRNHESRRFINLAIVKGRPAYEVIGISGALEEVPSMYVELLFENVDTNGKGVDIKILDFLKAYYEEGIEPVVGVVQIVNRSEDELFVPEPDQQKYMSSTEGLAVFKEDQLVGFLESKLTRGYNFATGNIKSAVIVSKSPDKLGINSVEVIKASGSLGLRIEDGKYYGSVDVEINGMLNEETGEEDISNPETIAKIEESTSEQIKGEIEESIKQAQQYKTDIFGFGREIHRKEPQEWKRIKNDWNDIFPIISIEVRVKTTIQKVGVSNEQLSVKEQK